VDHLVEGGLRGEASGTIGCPPPSAVINYTAVLKASLYPDPAAPAVSIGHIPGCGGATRSRHPRTTRPPTSLRVGRGRARPRGGTDPDNEHLKGITHSNRAGLRGGPRFGWEKSSSPQQSTMDGTRSRHAITIRSPRSYQVGFSGPKMGNKKAVTAGHDLEPWCARRDSNPSLLIRSQTPSGHKYTAW
jgi:hypothetical protein